jgi:pyruvate,water dikinase
MADESHVIWLEDCSADRAALVGGKATGLGSLIREGLQVPPGFALTTRAYREHLANNNLESRIQRLLADCTTFDAQRRASEAIRCLFESSRASSQLETEVLAAYERLREATAMASSASAGQAQATSRSHAFSAADTPVAVRSSATTEDLADASFAGQQETYLWILDGAAVLQHVVRCWASLFTPQAIAYRAHRLQLPLTDLAMGVVVQRMVTAEAAGVMLTIDPVNGDPSGIVIEAAYGLGAAVVNGEVTPDRVCVDKVLLEIRSRSIGTKTIAYRFDPSVQGTCVVAVPPELQTQPCLTDSEALQLASLGKRMERAMGRPQDMEWAIGPGPTGPRDVFLLQARPETVWSQKTRQPLASAGSSVMDRILQSMRASR